MIKRKNALKNFMFLVPSLIGVSIFVFLPFSDVIRRSFTDVSGSAYIGLENYEKLLNNTAFILALKNTGRFIGICVPVLLGLSLLIANFIYFGKFKFSQNIYLLPMAVPIASLVFVWKMIFHKNGLINSWIGAETDWINSSYAFGVLILSFIWKNLGYYIVLWIAGLGGIPGSIYEAAAIDGAGHINKFRYITLPGLRPMISATVILALTSALKSYREAYLLAGEYPNQSIYMIQHVFHNWYRDMSIEKMCAGAVIIVLVFATIVYPFRKREAGSLD